MNAKWILAILLVAAAVPADRLSYGAVDCDVNPDDAIVHVDGKALGPADDFDGWPDVLYLKAGTYSMEFRLEGYAPYRATVVVNAGELVRIRYTLNEVQFPPNEAEGAVEEISRKTGVENPEKGGSIRLKLFPENAVTYLNNRLFAYGEDLARLHGPLQIAAGRHIMLCYAPGYQEVAREFTVAPGEYLELEFVLDKE